MKKILLVLGVVGMLGCETVCYAAPEPLTAEVSLLSMLDDYDILEYMFIGKSLWEEEDEESKVDASEMLLDFFSAEGSIAEGYTPEDIQNLIDDAYEFGVSSDILRISVEMLCEEPQNYGDALQKVFHRQALTSEDAEYLLLDVGDFPKAALMYKDDWYGDRTDDERIALADSVLEILEAEDVDTCGYDGNTMAQALNDLYDEDAGDSVLYLILDTLGEAELYPSVVESIVLCVWEAF